MERQSEDTAESSSPCTALSTDVEHLGDATEKFEDREKQLEDLFKDRYTEKDPGYIETLEKANPPPPCVKDWWSNVRPKRDFNATRGEKRSWNDSNRNSDRHDRGYDRKEYGSYKRFRDNDSQRRSWNRNGNYQNR